VTHEDPDGDPDRERDGRRNGDFEPRPRPGLPLTAAVIRGCSPTFLLPSFDRLDRAKVEQGWVELLDLRGRKLHQLARWPHVYRYAQAIGVAIRWRKPQS
jgi:hypothetical protein